MHTLWLAVFTAFAVLETRCAAPTPPINVWLKSSWNTTNLVTEIIETASLEHADVFFPLLDILTDPEAFDAPLASQPPKTAYLEALKRLKDSNLLSGIGEIQSFERALALRTATPKIEAFHSYYTQHFPDTPLPPDCGSWVDWYGERICDAESLLTRVGYSCSKFTDVKGQPLCEAKNLVKLDIQQEKKLNRPTPLTFDHVHPAEHAQAAQLKVAVLYGSLTSPNFYSLHSILYELSSLDSPAVRYVFRHAPPPAGTPVNAAFLSGYGVALDLKKTDYLALDDRQNKGRPSASPESQTVLSDNEDNVILSDPILAMLPVNEESNDPAKPLDEEEMTALGFKTSQLILTSEQPLSTLKQVSQNFPKYAQAISRRVNLSDEVVMALGGNMRMVQAGNNMMWLNGKPIASSDMNPFGLLRLMRKERQLMTRLTSAGLSRVEAIEVMSHTSLSKSSGTQVVDGMFDASDRMEGGGLIIWLNDLEKDDRYSRWPTTLDALMQPAYGGQTPPLRRNIQNVVVALDLSKTASLATLNLLSSIIQRGFPIRFGVVPIAETDEAATIARVYSYLNHHYDPLQAFAIFAKSADPRRPTIEISHLRQVYDNIALSEDPLGSGFWLRFDDVTAQSDDPLDLIKRLQQYHSRLGTTNAESKSGHLFINGKYFSLSDDWLRTLQVEVSQQAQFIQEKIFSGELVDSEDLDMSVYFYDLPTTSKSRNALIYPSASGPSALRILPLLDLDLPKYFVYPHDTENAALSMWIVGDLDNENGLGLVRDALNAMASSSYRLSFVHVPSSETRTTSKYAAALTAVSTSEIRVSPTEVLEILDSIADDSKTTQERLRKLLAKSTELTVEEELGLEKAGKRIAQKMGLAPGETGIIVNGRVVAPLTSASFRASDFATLASYEMNKRTAPMQEALMIVMASNRGELEPITDDLLAGVSSIVYADQLPDPSMDGSPTPRSRPYAQLNPDHTSFVIGNNQTAIFNFGVILNPMSDAAQRYSSLLEWLADDELVTATVYLNPPHQVEQMPLKRFYQYNLDRELTFEADGTLSNSQVSFTDLPTEHLYTLAMDVPQAWLVRPRESLHDLDNILLEAIPEEERSKGVEAVFSLDYLVIEGHAREPITKAPPRGLQLQLTSNSSPITDTQVVANLGYFQLKAKPGVFELEMRPGRGPEIFEMVSAGNEGWESPSVEEAGATITVTSFEDITLYPIFRRKEGKENADVLADEAEEGGFFQNVASKVSSIFGSGKKTAEVAKRQADINIFTVASGLLYERFASIMILSVLKNTDKSVKFWFIENFLSPSFLEFIPHFAEEYGFEYELVTYKWPSWLRMPTEKQRIIWGYKILFLDVLFPMDLKKVIFVDADQIVRADLYELVTLDLHGAPYGYTPMGDDSEDMDGFRFWKTGYWKEHLAGRPYHISALYVVDLVRFRQVAAGDRLRGQYQGLSADPNSLANLDQGTYTCPSQYLPNNMQREVPIFSLHEDWLWCETWCSKDRLHRAKTIDLCQNPKTKEPKLSRARQIPEWEKYDSEIASFARKLVDVGKIRSSAAVENDVDALAGEKKAPGTSSTREDAVSEDSGEKTKEGHDEL